MTMPTPTDPATPPAVPTPPAPPAQPPAPTPVPVAPPQPQVPPTGQVPVPPVSPPQWTTPPALPQIQPPDDDSNRDMTHLPKWAQDEIKKLRDENASRRVSQRAETVARHAFMNSGILGVNGHALLGSVPFQTVAQQLDPNAPDFVDQLKAKVTEILAANPWMAAQPATAPPAPPAAPPAPGRSGGEFNGGNGSPGALTEADLEKMSPAEMQKAFEEGRLKHLM